MISRRISADASCGSWMIQLLAKNAAGERSGLKRANLGQFVQRRRQLVELASTVLVLRFKCSRDVLQVGRRMTKDGCDSFPQCL